ncbi:YceI family protein [Tessaracoccus sp. ZS01]|uniref:YceI family protein n=1 Tax=Tessaracoccus sp. ZS01 TaxID=1906324 RepID=UPI0011813AE5|nr:polyisoprenoid-binding protein [Tessaracoccus sp. ZS01]
MTALTALSGNYVIDNSHTEIGWTARHAMVTKVRGSFTDFEGTAATGANLEDAKINVVIQASSIDTGNADRDGHLRSGDFFDVETYPTIRFTSTKVTAAGEGLDVEGNLTIKDVTREVSIPFEYDGVAVDPFGNERVGLSGSVQVNRKDFGLVWNAALETGGVLVSENVNLVFEVSAIKQADEAAVEAEAVAEPVVEAQPVAETPAPARAAQPQTTAPATAQQGGFMGWLKRVFG